MNLPSENLRKTEVEINQKSTQAVHYVIEIVYLRYVGASRSYVEGNKIDHDTAIESTVHIFDGPKHYMRLSWGQFSAQ